MTEDELRETLASYRTSAIHATLYRATLFERDPLASSFRGGRWIPPGSKAVLYTSMSREGALAEIAFRLGLNTPLSTKPVKLHRIKVDSEAVLALSNANLQTLEVALSNFGSLAYDWTQLIGLAAFQIGASALQVPSARWPSDNLVILDEATAKNSIELIESEVVDWIAWARRFTPHFLSS